MRKVLSAFTVAVGVLAVSFLSCWGKAASESEGEGGATITIRSLKPGNVFFEEETVKFMLTAENLPSGAELRIQSVDFDGKVAASSKTSRYGGGRAVADMGFGKQPNGYYAVTAAIVKDGETVSEARSSYAVIVSPEKRTYRESSPFAIDVAAS
jgi:hypothetical protein